MQNFGRKASRKYTLLRPGMWEGNIKTDFNGMEGGTVDWIHLTQDIDQCGELL
jgi:hypothetical protein